MHDENIRDRCDELIRYLENRVRAILKMKNALSRIHISQEHKTYLEGILLEFNRFAPKSEEESNSFEIKKPLQRSLEVDPVEANKIEEASWVITQALTQDYMLEQGESVTVGSEPEQIQTEYKSELNEVERPLINTDENEFWEFAAQLTPEEDNLISLSLHKGKDVARKFASSLGAFFEAMVANCNEKAINSIGDAVMEPNGTIFDEYRKDMLQVFPEPKGDL